MVTISGGRDSTYILHQMAKVYKMHVLACSFDCGIQSELGKRNTKKICAELGVDLVIVPYKAKKNREMIRHNFMAWIRKPTVAMIPLLMLADKTMDYHMKKTAKQHGIKLIINGDSQVEYSLFKSGFLGVDATSHGRNIPLTQKLKLLWNYAKEYIRNPRYLSNLYDSLTGFFVYFYADKLFKDVRIINYFDYILWNEDDIVKTNLSMGWELPTDTILTWRNDDAMPPLYNYLYLRMVGFTENDTLRSNMIREGMMGREEALEITKLENRPRMETLLKLMVDLDIPYKLLERVPKL